MKPSGNTARLEAPFKSSYLLLFVCPSTLHNLSFYFLLLKDVCFGSNTKDKFSINLHYDFKRSDWLFKNFNQSESLISCPSIFFS